MCPGPKRLMPNGAVCPIAAPQSAPTPFCSHDTPPLEQMTGFLVTSASVRINWLGRNKLRLLVCPLFCHNRPFMRLGERNYVVQKGDS